MKERFNLSKVDSKAFAAMLHLEKYLAESGLDKILSELIKIRASQINGCAYCINMHVRDALKYGETAQRIFLLNAWRETDLFTEKERAVLALTESMTLIANNPVSDAVFEEAQNHLTHQEMAAVMMCIVTINAWNRIVLTSKTALD